MNASNNNERIIKGSNKARKTASRLAAVQCYYQARHNEQAITEVLDEYIQHRHGKELDGERYVASDLKFLEKTIRFADQNTDDITEILDANLSGHQTLKSLEALLQAVLICATAEIWTHTDVDAGIIVNDYINVTKAFYDGNEYQLVNGVLDTIAKTLRKT